MGNDIGLPTKESYNGYAKPNDEGRVKHETNEESRVKHHSNDYNLPILTKHSSYEDTRDTEAKYLDTTKSIHKSKEHLECPTCAMKITCPVCPVCPSIIDQSKKIILETPMTKENGKIMMFNIIKSLIDTSISYLLIFTQRKDILDFIDDDIIQKLIESKNKEKIDIIYNIEGLRPEYKKKLLKKYETKYLKYKQKYLNLKKL